MDHIYKTIKKDKQIWKFCFYGLLKNLRFFEPYLLIYLMNLGLNLFKIGILFSVREIFIYVFEVPSGIFADHYGKKKELMICFTFYMISFVFFFLGINFYVLIIAMVFYGLGEAFRSGTHKSMIYSYLEQKDWFQYKAFVYGRTRSFSLIGSSISAFISIIFILNLPEVKWVFLLCIIPYILDFLLILSYPDRLDERRKGSLNLKEFFKTCCYQLKRIFASRKLTKILLSSSLYESIFKSIKDYIQPILEMTILAVSVVELQSFAPDKKIIIYLGIVYGVFNILSSFVSRNVYKLNKVADSSKLMVVLFDVMGVLSVILFVAIKNSYTLIIIVTFLILYVLKAARRPLVVDVYGDYMKKDERATVLSVDSQLRSLFTVVFAPLFGFIADQYSLSILFLFIGILIIIINRFLDISNIKSSTIDIQCQK